MLYNASMETMALTELRKLQDQRLKEQVAYVYDRVPFYRQQLDQANINPATFQGLKEIHKLPFTYKKALRDNYPFGLFAVKEQELMRLHCSSGTTGKPTVVGYTKEDIDIFAESVARSLAAGGCRPGMKLQNAYGYGLFTGGLGLHYGAEKLGMTVIPISGGGTDRQLMLLQDFQSEVISCTPSYALTLAEELKKRDIPLSAINLKYAVLGAEPWTETIRAQVEKGLGVKAVNIYGLSEVMGPGVSMEDVDEQGTGSYIWEDHFFPEVVDRHTGEPLPEGELGVLVFTTLTKKAMPVLRYYTNDITNIYYDKSIKRTHIKMGPIRGRSDDMLIIRGVNLFHTQIEEIINEIGELSAYYQLIVTRKGSMDEVDVVVELRDEVLKALEISEINEAIMEQYDLLRNIKGYFSKKIKDNCGLSMRVTLAVTGTIPRSEGGKVSHIDDRRHLA
ncbi:phenylacetate--CoA ligase family protein [Taibaiella soli]|uniref:Phenylacetate-coenzyme A ligase n=1 Tax=Taibaiella soli TaxID=1649169 RepID=A0A2W2AX17_9BACT|nr:AMP-binding protein [Taibaiella soli]PZF72524.1 phenylacetate--CoA ligase [Taibaiella soli]